MQVPVLSGPSQFTEPLPSIRAGADSFGVPRAPQLQGLEEQAHGMWQQATEHANQVAVQDAAGKLISLSSDISANAVQQKGKNAFTAIDTAKKQFTDAHATLSAGLSPAQRDAFDGIAASRWNALHNIVQFHVAQQRTAYDEQTTEAAKGALLNDTLQHYDNPEVVGLNIDQMRGILLHQGDRNGAPPEAVAQDVGKMVSQMHAGVVQRLIDNTPDGQLPEQASRYMEAHRDELLPAAQEKLDNALAQQHQTAQGYQAADAIQKKALTFSDALKETDKIQDEGLRKKVTDIIRRRFEDEALSQRLAQETAFQTASQIVGQTRDVSRVPREVWSQLSGTHVESLMRMQDQLRNPEKKTNPDTFNALVNIAGLSKATRAYFDGLYLPNYAKDLSEADLKYLIKLQHSDELRTEAVGDKASAAAAKKAEATAKTEAAFKQVNDLIKDPEVRAQRQREHDAEVRKSQGATPSPVPGGPIQPLSPLSAVPTPQAPVGHTVDPTRTAVCQDVPATWKQHARQVKAYGDYLKHCNVAF